MIQLTDVTKKFNPGKPNELIALDHINLEIKENEMLAVMGRSGAGKSTLVHIISCLEPITSGAYLFQNQDISRLSNDKIAKIRNQKIGILLQNFALIQTLTALENCMVPLYFSPTLIGQMKKQALSALDALGIRDLAQQVVGTMSGGQQQRVALARALVCGPDLIIADEPTGALDSHTAQDIMSELKKLHESGKTIIIVTHDRSVAERCDAILQISDGKIEKEG